MFPLSLRPIEDINFCSWLGSARNRGHKVCFERDIVIQLFLSVGLMGIQLVASNFSGL